MLQSGCSHRSTENALVQNTAPSSFSKMRKYEHISPILVLLHSLPVAFRINSKILLERLLTVAEYELLGLAESSFHTELDILFCPILFSKLF